MPTLRSTIGYDRLYGENVILITGTEETRTPVRAVVRETKRGDIAQYAGAKVENTQLLVMGGRDWPDDFDTDTDRIEYQGHVWPALNTQRDSRIEKVSVLIMVDAQR